MSLVTAGMSKDLCTYCMSFRKGIIQMAPLGSDNQPIRFPPPPPDDDNASDPE